MLMHTLINLFQPSSLLIRYLVFPIIPFSFFIPFSSLFPLSLFLIYDFHLTTILFPFFLPHIISFFSTTDQESITDILKSENLPVEMEPMRHTQILKTTVGIRGNVKRHLEAWMDQSLPLPVSTHELGHNNFRLNEHERKLSTSTNNTAENSPGEK